MGTHGILPIFFRVVFIFIFGGASGLLMGRENNAFWIGRAKGWMEKERENE